VLSSGIVITLHECCTKHHHTKNEHNHCHETKIFIKIEDDFIKSEATHFSPSEVEKVLFFSISINHIFEIITPHFLYSIPPLLKFVGVNFVNFTSQRVFYS
jgi:hypothetical protein